MLSVPTTSLVYTTMLAAMKLRIALPTKKKRQERGRDSHKRDRGTVNEPKTLKVKLKRKAKGITKLVKIIMIRVLCRHRTRDHKEIS